MRRNLAGSVIEHGTVRTTVAKAKEVRPFVEKLITIARKGTLHARRRVISLLQDRAMVDKDNPDEVADKTLIGKLFDEVAPRYIDRPGGYTRIIHLAERRIGDAGKQVLLQLVEEGSGSSAAGEGGTGSSRRKRAARRAEAAKEIAEAADAEADSAVEEATEEVDEEPQAEPAEEENQDEGKSE